MPRTYLVTGAAGFIGSHLAQTLLSRGHRVVGVDVLTEYYDPSQKRRNLDALQHHGDFEFHQSDLGSADLEELIAEVDVVCHLAAQPGVRSSWGEDFRHYVHHNVLVTQRVLEACRSTPIDRLVFASSSSVYGNAPQYPTAEDSPVQPRSPYGVTKSACELLVRAYADAFGVPAVSLRYFTVYGPRQRPDMAIHRLIRSALLGEPFPLYGDGGQVRDFTFVADVVDATIRAGEADVPAGTAINVSGGSSVSMRELLALVEQTTGAQVNVAQRPVQHGDVDRTGARTDRAERLLGWQPRVDLVDGLSHQVAWHRGVDLLATETSAPVGAR